MRNLKKTLCLVLAMVFVLGLCTAGAVDTTQYGDEDEITYDAAVTAMSGLGILQGDDNDGDGVNEFRPKDPVTRAQAAKIIAYLVLGKEDAEKWPARTSFDDVSADHWAARYITYCQTNGIINGYGNGNFGPNDPVSKAAFAKMLLASAGYGKKDEFIGENWLQNVATAAIQNKVTKGLPIDNWETPATREETAQLAYNGLMNVVRVVLSQDTSSYVPETINGVSNVTLAQSAWNLITEEGVIIANKANSSTAKGTVLSGGVRAYYVTDMDEDVSALGHKVQITYRLESAGTGDVAVAYFVDDPCTEVDGAAAAKLDDAAFQYRFANGELTGGAVPPKSARATAEGVFVLDGENMVVSYKTESFFLAALAVNEVTGIATVTEPYGGTSVTVTPPAGAKKGDILTVYHCGDIYTAEPTVRVTDVAITQAQLDKVTGTYVYNDGAIRLSKADNLGTTAFAGATKMDGTAQLEVGYSYTLFFDSKGGCYGFADKIITGGTVIVRDYALLVATFTGTDTYGATTYNAQVIKADGTIQNLPIAKATYDSAPVVGKVYNLSTQNGYTVLGAVAAGETEAALYSTQDPITDYSQATYVWYNGSLGSLEVKTGLKPKTGSGVIYTYTSEKEGTINLKKIKTVWFTVPESSVVTVTNSFIYVEDTAKESTRLVNGVAADFYAGYLNGVKMTDLTTSTAPAKIGFATYSKDEAGVYTLTYLPDGDGTATGARSVVMSDMNSNYFFLNGKLWVADSLGNKQSMDLTGVKFVKVGPAAASTVAADSVEAIQSAMVSGYKFTIAFVEVVAGDGTHTIGGSVLYVTAIA